MLTDITSLLVSELVTNSVRYGRRRCDLELVRRPGNVLVVRVTDDGEGMPEVKTTSPEDVSGRGLAIVDALAHRWGVERAEPGAKAVWFELRADNVAPTWT
jgi:two-component sensor histidine kinase